MGKLTRTYAYELLHALQEAGFEKFNLAAAQAVALRRLGVASPASIRRYLLYLEAVDAVAHDHVPGVWKIRQREE